MKNLLWSALLLISTFAMAQPGERGDRGERRMPSPEVQAKRMTLALDLSEKQEKQVLQLMTDQKASMDQTRLTKEERKELSPEQKEAQAVKMLDKKIEMKRKLKKILSEEQYERWEKMMAKRAQKARIKRAKRRS
jgi:hypothetical protein